MIKTRYILIIYIFVVTAVVYMLNQVRLHLLEQYLLNKTQEVEHIFLQTINNYEIPARILYEEVIHKPEVLQIMQNAARGDSSEQHFLRQQLYDQLQPTYQRISALNYRQLHFHLPNNHSFLRFHRPEKYGDDLTNIRETVRKVNQDHVHIKGFEEGRIFNGFRYVSPLIYLEEHVGSVETSISFNTINASLNQSPSMFCDFMLAKESVEEKVFFDQKDFYVESRYSDQYYQESVNMLEIRESRLNKMVNLEEVVRKLYPHLQEPLLKMEKFSRIVKLEGVNIIASFYPVNNFLGKKIGWQIFLRPTEVVGEIFLPVAMVAAVLISLIFAFIVMLNQTSQRLKKQESHLNASNQTKDKLFSILAHDLMSPFSQITGFLDVLINNRHEFKENELQHYLELIQNNTKNTFRLLQNLLSWSRIQREQIRFNPSAVDLTQVLNESLEQFELTLNKKKVTIMHDLYEPNIIWGDEDMIRTIFRNMISNAIKFSFPGGNIEIVGRQTEDAGYQLSFRDQGVGMPPETIKLIESGANHRSSPGTKNEKGTGLGLMLCLDFIKQHEGWMRVKSKENVGTTFMFYFPVNNADITKPESKVLYLRSSLRDPLSLN